MPINSYDVGVFIGSPQHQQSEIQGDKMTVIPVPKSLASYKGNGKALARIKNGKIVALYYEGTTLIHREYVLRITGKKRWCKAAEQKLSEIKAQVHQFRNVGEIIVISGTNTEIVTGSVEDFGYVVDHDNHGLCGWEYPPGSS